MRVARSIGAREVRIEDVPDPVAGDDGVVCRVLACGVCGSDVSEPYVSRKLPAVLGHEVVGEVLDVGPSAATGVRPGDRVVVHHHVPCGECRRCFRGHETLCEQFRATAIEPGGFAERVRVPPELLGELLPLGDLDPVTATFVEPLACVLRALRRTLDPGGSLLVVGAGTQGLLAILAAHALGAEAVWVRDPREDRRHRAEALGATHHADEPVDVAFVTTSAAAAVQEAGAALAPGGVLCLYATAGPGASVGVDAEQLLLRDLTVCSSYSAGPQDMRAALALIASGRVDPAPLVSHRVGLQDTGDALELQRSRTGLKVVVVP